MKVRVPLTGSTKHYGAEWGPILSLLDEAGIIEILPNSPVQPPLKTRWRVDRNADGQACIRASCDKCKVSEHQLFPTAFRHCGVAEQPPAEIVETYAIAKRQFKQDMKDPSLQGKPARGPIAVLERADNSSVSYEPGDPGN